MLTTEEKEMLQRSYQEFFTTDNFKVASVSVVCDIQEFTATCRKSKEERDFSSSIGYKSPKTDLAIEEKYIDCEGKTCYFVVAFVRWNPDTKRSHVDPVDGRLRDAHKDAIKRLELKDVIAKTKKIQKDLNNA